MPHTATQHITAVRQLDPFNRQSQKSVQVVEGSTLQSIFDELAAVVPEYQDLVLFLNAKPVLRASWNYQVQHNDHVLIKPYPRGGDDGGGMRTMATFAVAAAAMSVGGPAGAAIMIGGNLAINAFMPLPKPPTAQLNQPFSSTYQSQSRGNLPKLMQPKPVQFGNMRVVPDEAARSYFSYENNQQVHHQLLCLGAGDYFVDEDKIILNDDDTNSFEDVQLQVVQRGGALSLVNDTVTPSSINNVEVHDNTNTFGNLYIGLSEKRQVQFGDNGDTMTFQFHYTANDYRELAQWFEVKVGDTIRLRHEDTNIITSTSMVVVEELRGPSNELRSFKVDRAGWTQEYADSFLLLNGAFLNGHPIRWDEDTNAPYVKKSKAFTINSTTDINFIEFDCAIPKGDWGDVSLAIETRTIDANNNPDTDWQTQALTIERSEALDNYTSTRIAVPAGRYQIRFYRDQFRQHLGDQLFLHGIKGIGSEAANTTMSVDCTLLAVKVPVPPEKNITFGHTKVVMHSILPELQFDGSSYTWSAPVATSQISAALGESLRLRHGASFESYLMPLDELYALQQTWTARGDEFNGRFDQQLVLKEALSLIARAGRAVSLEVGDRWYFVRDEPGVAAYPYGPANILTSGNGAEPHFSISHKYPLPDDPDGIIVEYFNRAVWEWDETPSYPTDALRPQRIRFFGITDQLHAWRECCYLYYRSIIKPSTVTWRTELEALNHDFGDLLSIAPPKSSVYGAGTVNGFEGDTFSLSEKLDWSDTGYHFLTLRRDDGTMSGPYEVVQGSALHECVLKPGSVLDIVPHDGISSAVQKEPTHYQFGKSGTGLMCRLVGRKQVGSHSYELSAEVVMDAAHNIDSTPYPI